MRSRRRRPGKLRRIVAQADDVVVVGGLLGVLSEGDVSDQEIDTFAAGFAIEIFEDAAAPEPVTTDIGGQRVRYLRIGPERSEKLPILLVHGLFWRTRKLALCPRPLAARSDALCDRSAGSWRLVQRCRCGLDRRLYGKHKSIFGCNEY